MQPPCVLLHLKRVKVTIEHRKNGVCRVHRVHNGVRVQQSPPDRLPWACGPSPPRADCPCVAARRGMRGLLHSLSRAGCVPSHWLYAPGDVSRCKRRRRPRWAWWGLRRARWAWRAHRRSCCRRPPPSPSSWSAPLPVGGTRARPECDGSQWWPCRVWGTGKATCLFLARNLGLLMPNCEG